MLSLLLLFATAAFAQDPSPRYTLERGIWVEQFGAQDSTENRYTANNQLYPEGAKITYRYHYIDRAGNKFLQKVVAPPRRSREKAWALVPANSRDSLTNDRLQLIIESDLQGIDSTIRGYNHTPIRWEYLAPSGRLYFLEQASLVENRKNIWLQPPLGRMFQLLALNPYPFVMAPYVVGREWTWEQQIPSYWGDARWREWTGTITTTYRYKITGKEVVDTAFGKLSCFVIEAKASSSLGTTSLTAYFHPASGFLTLYYRNIDDSQLLLEMIGKE